MAQFLYRLNEISIGPKKINHYTLLPSYECYQEDLMKSLKRIKGCTLKWVAQQDGSRLRIISSTLSPSDIIANIMLAEPGRDTICREEEYLSGSTTDIAIWTHTFLNGARCVLLRYNSTTQSFIDLGKGEAMKELQASDGLGAILEYDGDGPILNGLYNGLESKVPIVKFFSKIRMCHCCGIVSNITRPRDVPWITRRSETF